MTAPVDRTPPQPTAGDYTDAFQALHRYDQTGRTYYLLGMLTPAVEGGWAPQAHHRAHLAVHDALTYCESKEPPNAE